MAEDKKGFILYADQKEIFDILTIEQQGELISTIFKYVNDENPIVKDKNILMAFTLIKQVLKRDLEKYEQKKAQWSSAGKASAEARKKKKKRSTDSTNVKDRSTDSTVIVKDTVTVNVIDNVIDINKRGVLNNWLDYRKEIKKPIKSESTLKSLAKKFNEKSFDELNYVVNASIENGWQGLIWDKYNPGNKNQPKTLKEQFNHLLTEEERNGIS